MYTRSRILETLPIAYYSPFKLQPEDSFMKKPKHVANMILYLSSNYILRNKGYFRPQKYIHSTNITL